MKRFKLHLIMNSKGQRSKSQVRTLFRFVNFGLKGDTGQGSWHLPTNSFPDNTSCLDESIASIAFKHHLYITHYSPLKEDPY